MGISDRFDRCKSQGMPDEEASIAVGDLASAGDGARAHDRMGDCYADAVDGRHGRTPRGN
jgi:hypothetical protein